MADKRKNQYSDIYNNTIPKQVKKLLKLGWKVEEVCDFLDISRVTFNNWKREKPEFREAVRAGENQFATEKVELKLIKRAQGYNYTQTSEEVTQDVAVTKDGQQVPYTKTKTVKKKIHVPANVAAQKLFLAAHLPEIYGDKLDITSGGQQLVRQDILDLTPQERAERLIKMFNAMRKVNSVEQPEEEEIE